MIKNFFLAVVERKKIVFALLFVLLINLSHGQIIWDKQIVPDTTGYFWGPRTYTTHATLDKGYILAGDIGYWLNDRIYVWAKVDSLGNYDWAHMTVGGGHNNVLWSITEDLDSNLYVCGTSYPYPGDPPIPKIYKSDKEGNVIWVKTLSGNNISIAYDIICTADGGTMILANSCIPPYTDFYRDIILVKLDSSGNIEWSKTYGSNDRDGGYSVIQTLDSGYVACGFTESFGTYSMLIFRTDAMGNFLWSKVISGIDIYEAVSIIQTDDSNLIATGYPVTYASGAYGSGIIKLNLAGDTLWSKTIGSGDTLGLTTVIETADHNLVFMGQGSLSSGSKVHIIKTDSTCQPIWNRVINNGNYLAHCPIGEKTADGGLIMVGGNGFGLNLCKLDSSGLNGCNNSFSLPFVNNTQLQLISPTLSETTDTILSVSSNFIEYGPGDSTIITNCLSVTSSEMFESENIQIYPNPTAGNFTIKNSVFGENSFLEIFNTLGEKIYSAAYRDGSTVNCEHFPPGIYFVRLSDSKKQLTRKLVVE